MRSLLRRALCMLLCLCLLAPGLSLADQDVTALRFDLSFQMEPEAFPQEQRSLLRGIADLVNILTLEGTLEQAATGCFDLNAQLLLDRAEETRTSLRLYGLESHWGIESSLLGDEMLMVNMLALLEFSIKAYFHLNLPLQNVALLISPFVHTSALDPLFDLWQRTMLTKTTKRTISRKSILSMAKKMTEFAAIDRTFQYWVQALALDAGYDEAIMDFMADLPDWVKSSVNSKGITVAIKNGTETWTTGKTTLFTRTVEGNVTSWSLTLPTTLDGFDLSAGYSGQPNGEHLLQVTITDKDQATLLDLFVRADNIPDPTSEMPINAPFSLEVKTSGKAVRNPLHLLFEGEGQDGNFSLRMLDPQSRALQLMVTGTLIPYTPEKAPHFTPADMSAGMNLLSMNDVTLTELIGKIRAPLMQGGLPLLIHAPATSVQTLMDLLTEHGIIDLVLSGGAAPAPEEYYD